MLDDISIQVRDVAAATALVSVAPEPSSACGCASHIRCA